METAFQHGGGSPEQGSEVRLRTIMQLDGDIINFLPDPRTFPDNADWHQAYTEGQREHQEKIQCLMTGFEGIHSLVWVTVNITTATIAVGSFVRALQKNSPYKAVAVVCLFPVITYIAVYTAKMLLRMMIKFLLKKSALTEFLGRH